MQLGCIEVNLCKLFSLFAKRGIPRKSFFNNFKMDTTYILSLRSELNILAKLRQHFRIFRETLEVLSHLLRFSQKIQSQFRGVSQDVIETSTSGVNVRSKGFEAEAALRQLRETLVRLRRRPGRLLCPPNA